MKVFWTPRAQLRLQENHDRIAEDQPVNAKRWLETIISRGDQIGAQPRSGRVVPEYGRETIREIFEGDYRIIFRIRSRQIDVLTVRHGAKPLPSSLRRL